MSQLETRRLTVEDAPQFYDLGKEAFGALPPGTPPPDMQKFPGPGRDPWGTFDGDRLVARAVGKDLHSWFGGRAVPTCGVAGVTVLAEERGRGRLTALMGAVLDAGGERGAVVSTLFPTAPGIYRRFGYEIVGAHDEVEVPIAAAGAVPLPDDIRTRRGTGDDLESVRAVFDTWARHQHGPLTRRGVSFPTGDAVDAAAIDSFTGITLAETSAGRLVGYAAWDRGQGYDDRSVIDVTDLISIDERATRALWHTLGSFSSVAGRIRLHTTSTSDTARLVLPTLAWRVTTSHAYMLRIDDVAGALSGAALPAVRDLELTFTVEGEGGFHLTVTDGTTTCTRDDTASGAEFTRRGLALAWAGVQATGTLRMAGLLRGDEGQDPTYDVVLAALRGGRPIQVRDYF